MMTLTEIKIKIQKLYNTNPQIHINVHSNRPKMYYDNVPAIIRGVYPHIFQLEINEENQIKSFYMQYEDVLIKRVEIIELTGSTQPSI
ncbi:MAG: hypothetical protein J6P37_02360 [Lachnospiraceae bacterium]|jgi:uncharacterized protein Veg|nr:hypothetical protein [Lachnospiraceae bacterium]